MNCNSADRKVVTSKRMAAKSAIENRQWSPPLGFRAHNGECSFQIRCKGNPVRGPCLATRVQAEALPERPSAQRQAARIGVDRLAARDNPELQRHVRARRGIRRDLELNLFDADHAFGVAFG